MEAAIEKRDFLSSRAPVVVRDLKCLNDYCRHGSSRHALSTIGRRGPCLVLGCWCAKLQRAEPYEGEWIDHLWRLRATGRRRAQNGNPSSSVLRLLDRLPDGAMIVDVGCGDSGDRMVAEQLGLVAYGVDLFPPFEKWLETGFVQADALRLPFASQSVDGIVFHAAASLIKPIDRPSAYSEMARILKPGGWLSMSLYWLADGYPVIASEEDAIIRRHFLRLRTAALYRTTSV